MKGKTIYVFEYTLHNNTNIILIFVLSLEFEESLVYVSI